MRAVWRLAPATCAYQSNGPSLEAKGREREAGEAKCLEAEQQLVRARSQPGVIVVWRAKLVHICRCWLDWQRKRVAEGRYLQSW